MLEIFIQTLDVDGSSDVSWEEFLDYFSLHEIKFSVVDQAVLQAKIRGDQYWKQQRKQQSLLEDQKREREETIRERQKRVEENSRKAFEEERQQALLRKNVSSTKGGARVQGDEGVEVNLTTTIPVFSATGKVMQLDETVEDTSVSLEVG